jgi:hypothetical protein
VLISTCTPALVSVLLAMFAGSVPLISCAAAMTLNPARVRAALTRATITESRPPMDVSARPVVPLYPWKLRQRREPVTSAVQIGSSKFVLVTCSLAKLLELRMPANS